MIELKDLPFESQFQYRTLCDDIDKCTDINKMREKFKEILLEHLKHQEATSRFLREQFKKL